MEFLGCGYDAVVPIATHSLAVDVSVRGFGGWIHRSVQIGGRFLFVFAHKRLRFPSFPALMAHRRNTQRSIFCIYFNTYASFVMEPV